MCGVKTARDSTLPSSFAYLFVAVRRMEITNMAGADFVNFYPPPPPGLAPRVGLGVGAL